MRVVLLVLALTADLPNANLPGNSPSLPNANLPGSLPDDNPISLPNTDTSQAVIQPDSGWLFTPEGVPRRNPTLPPTLEETQAAQAPERRLEQQLSEAHDDAARAREDAAAAREEAARLREAQPEEQAPAE